MTSLCQMVAMFKETNVSQGTFARLKKKRLEKNENCEKNSGSIFDTKESIINVESKLDKEHFEDEDNDMLFNAQKNIYSCHKISVEIENQLKSNDMREVLLNYQNKLKPISVSEKFIMMPKIEDLVKIDLKKVKPKNNFKLNQRYEFFSFNTASPDDIVQQKQNSAFK